MFYRTNQSLFYLIKKFKSFEEARKFTRMLKLKSAREWHTYCKSGKKPKDIPSNVQNVYINDWKGFEDWLGYASKRSAYKKFRSFEDARKYVRKINLTSQKEWIDFTKSDQKPTDIPTSPSQVYKKEWKGIGDWLGTDIPGSKYGKFRSFEDARNFVRNLQISGEPGWRKYRKSGKKPKDIPYHPELTYRNDWKGWVDWTGIDASNQRIKKARPFNEARNYVRQLGLKSTDEWNSWKKSGKKPTDIPATPALVYKKEWNGMSDWLGNKNQPRHFSYRKFEEAKNFVHALKLKTGLEWKKYCKSGKKPTDIPATPERFYKKEWKGIGDWLGTGNVALQNIKFRSFEDARNFARSLNLKNSQEWENFCKSGKKPKDIPYAPSSYYKEDFVDFSDWLGTENIWSTFRIKELLKGLIDSGIIYQWNDAVLYSFLLRKGLLNLSGGSRFNNFFKNLLNAIKTPIGREAIEDFVNSSYNTPPDFSKIIELNELPDPEFEIESASSDELVELLDDSDPLAYANIVPVEDVLRHTDTLESINVDEEAMKFYVTYSINQIWKNAFKNENETIEKIKNISTNGNKYHDEVVQTFLEDYENTKNLDIPSGYSFPELPLLMQRYVSYKIMTQPYFGNFSGTGAGKTLSGILASRIIDSKLTLIVCPNDVVTHWESQINDIFPDSEIILGKDAFFAKRNPRTHTYAILNYDKFNQPTSSPKLLSELSTEKIDFVILDEIHFSKIRDANVSTRRQNLDALMTEIRKRNPRVKTLGVSATPVVNNLQEGRSLLELITGKIYDDVATRATIPNAVTLYEKLSTISIREMPDYPIHLDTQIVDVEAEKPNNIEIKQLKSNPLTIEKILTDYRIPEIIRLINGQTIIYTEYVEEIVEKIADAVRNAGYSFGRFTGSDHSGLKKFLNKKIQVLIASRPISTGIDGLQQICNRLIINTLPWTNAQYQQLLGRLVRRGQIQNIVHVYVLKTSIGGYPYDQLKLDRIKFKKTLADCAVDGTLPEKNLITPAQAMTEAVKWLERLERGEISTVTRRDLNVKLNPTEIEQRIKKYGDFERFNQRINTEKSETTHLRLNENTEEWLEYHRQYREARETWTVIPFEHWISRLKQLSTRLEIGDFGCGEAKIQEEFGDRVHSFDHVAINQNVTSCDVSSVPLDDGSLDVVIFSLSLMGRNWSDYIKEASRCLPTNGFVFLSETTNALNGRLSSLKDILKENEFEVYDESENGHFTFIEARKI